METAFINTYYVILYKDSVLSRSFLWDSKCYFASQ